MIVIGASISRTPSMLCISWVQFPNELSWQKVVMEAQGRPLWSGITSPFLRMSIPPPSSSPVPLSAQNVTIGAKTVALARAGMSKDCKGGITYNGNPAQLARAGMKELAVVRRLAKS